MKSRFVFTALMILIAMGTNAQHYISGNVWYHQNPEYPIEGVLVELYDAAGVLFGQETTDFDGAYSFSDVPEGIYSVKVSTDLPGMQVSMEEAMMILLHLNGSYALNPMELMAADVDGNGEVNFSDFMFIMVKYFIFNQPFPAGNWVFETIEVTAGSREGSQGIGGSRIGDVEGVFIPTGRDLLDHFEPVISGTLEFVDTEIVNIPLSVLNSDKAVSGYGLVLEYDPNIVEIIDVEAFGDQSQFILLENTVRIAWISKSANNLLLDGNLVNLQVKFLKEVDDFVAFKLTNESHVLDGNGEKIERLEFAMPVIKKNKNELMSTVYPNPTQNKCFVQFDSDKIAQSELMVVDQSGRILQQFFVKVTKGNNLHELDLSDLPSGQYLIMLLDQYSKDIKGHYKIIKN